MGQSKSSADTLNLVTAYHNYHQHRLDADCAQGGSRRFFLDKGTFVMGGNEQVDKRTETDERLSTSLRVHLLYHRKMRRQQNLRKEVLRKRAYKKVEFFRK